jgi:TetR/AcrR family transcriptional regulator, tetracycline repressor protein
VSQVAPPARISRESILRAALELLDQHGLAELSMRTLATELDVKAASLYYHVRNKTALLQLVSDHIAAQANAGLRPSMGWRELLQRLAGDLRSALREHPGAAAVVAVQHVSPEVAKDVAPTALASLGRDLAVGEAEVLYLVQSLYVLVTGHALAQFGNVPEPPAAPEAYYDDWFEIAVGTFLAGIETRYQPRRSPRARKDR